MVPRPLVPARAMRSRTWADVIHPCCSATCFQCLENEFRIGGSVS